MEYRFIQFAILLALAALSIAPARSSDTSGTVRLNASWWSTLPEEMQVGVIEGAMSGIETGYQRGLAKVWRDSHGAVPLVSLEYSPSFSHTFGFYRSAITDFYVTHPKAGKAEIGAVMECLSDKPLFTCDQVAKRAAGGEYD